MGMFRYLYLLNKINLPNINVDAMNDKFYTTRCMRYLLVLDSTGLLFYGLACIARL